MTAFEQWVNELDKLPKITTFCVTDENDEPVLVNGKIIEAQEYKVHINDRAEAEKNIMQWCDGIMHGNKVWIRTLPTITEYPNELETTFMGRTRIAVSPLSYWE